MDGNNGRIRKHAAEYVTRVEGRGCVAAHRRTHDPTTGGSEPYFRGPRSGLFWRKYSMADFYEVGKSYNNTLAYKSVAISAGIDLLPYANIKRVPDLGIKSKYALPKMDRWFTPCPIPPPHRLRHRKCLKVSQRPLLK